MFIAGDKETCNGRSISIRRRMAQRPIARSARTRFSNGTERAAFQYSARQQVFCKNRKNRPMTMTMMRGFRIQILAHGKSHFGSLLQPTNIGIRAASSACAPLSHKHPLVPYPLSARLRREQSNSLRFDPKLISFNFVWDASSVRDVIRGFLENYLSRVAYAIV